MPSQFSLTIVAALALTAHGFNPMPPRLSSHATAARALRATEPDVTWGSEVDSEAAETARQAMAKEDVFLAGVKEKAGGVNEGTTDSTYQGLTDGDSFDGGDGQNGVVGDGTLNMETFDRNQVTGVDAEARTRRAEQAGSIGAAETKKRQKVAFGETTGYADKLKEEGMVELNDYGEDIMLARRQQLENWGNQQEVKKQRLAAQGEIAQFNGQEWNTATIGKADAYRDSLGGQGTGVAPPSASAWGAPVSWGAPSDDAETDVGKPRSAETFDTSERAGTPAPTELPAMKIIATNGGKGLVSLELKNDVMTYEPFQAGFVDAAAAAKAGFWIEPFEGTLNGAKGDPTDLTIFYAPPSSGPPTDATLVIVTEESKWIVPVTGASA